MLATGGVYAAFASHGTVDRGARLTRTPVGPGHLVRAYELGSAKFVPVFRLGNGDRVQVIKGHSASCLVLSKYGHRTNEACLARTVLSRASAAEAHGSSPQGIIVTDECGYSGQNRMEIAGLVPEGVTGVRLEESSGSARLAKAVAGAFKFEGTNPRAGDPYPTGVKWFDGNVEVGAERLPVQGAEFCLPTE